MVRPVEHRYRSVATVPADEARGLRRLMVWQTKRQYGGVLPGIFEIMLPSLRLGFASGLIYNHLHLRKSSPLSRLQREMLATVVNGLIGGAP
jgi:hypothetical protein